MGNPNFLVVGAQRAGTSFLWGLLDQHPEIFVPKVKEIHYFDDKFRYNLSLEDYQSHFTGINHQSAVGDITPEYMYMDWVPKLIVEEIGRVKLVFLLRDPIERAYSHYWYMVLTRREHLSFEGALAAEQDRIKRNYVGLRNYSYATRGLYMEQIRRYLEYFNKDEMFFILSENLYREPQGTFNDICEFLGVSNYSINKNIYTHHSLVPKQIIFYRALTKFRMMIRGKRGYYRIEPTLRNIQGDMKKEHIEYPEIDDLIRKKLAKLFEDDIKRLEGFLGTNLDTWMNK